MSIRLLAGLCALVVVVGLAGCRATTSAGAARNDGYNHLDAKDYTAAGLAFDRAAALAKTPEDKAKALTGAGRASLEAGDARGAIRLFYEARRESPTGKAGGEASRGLGEAYLRLGEYSLARRYLLKGLDGASGELREETIARLVVCARGLEDMRDAAQQRSQLSQPFSEEVRRILDTGVVAVVEPSSGFDPETEEQPRKRVQPPRSAGPLPPPVTYDGGEARIQVIPRESWNAKPPRGNIDPMGTIEKITVHHSGGDTFWGVSKTDAADEIRKIQRYHQTQQGWADIGYHYIIDRNGSIWQGRRLSYQGAHARGNANHGNVGIVLLGNYLEQGIGTAQRRSLEVLVSKLCRRFLIPPQMVYTHREIVHGKTDCPGPALTRCVHEIRESLRHRVASYGVP